MTRSNASSTAILAATATARPDPLLHERLLAAGFRRVRVKGAGNRCWARGGQLWEEYGALRQLQEETACVSSTSG